VRDGRHGIPRGLRRAGPAQRAALVVLAAGLATLVAGTAVRDPGAGQLPWLDVWVYNLVYVAAAVLLLTVRASPLARRAWRLFALGALLSGAGNVWFSLVLTPEQQSHLPTFADALYLAWYPLAYVAVLALVRDRVGRPPAGQTLDGLVAGLGAAAVAVATVVGGTLVPAGAEAPEVLTGLAYPIADLVLLLLLVVGGVLLGGRGDRATVVLALGVATTAVADLTYLVEAGNDSYVEGGWGDLLFPAGIAVMAVAAVLRPARRDGVAGASGPWAHALPLTFGLACAVVAGLQQGGLVAWQAAVPADLGLLVALARAALTVRQLRAAEARERAELDRLAHTDELTGLPNRRALLEECVRLLDGPTRRVCVLIVDIDRFKEVNDSLGHGAGDGLLVAFAERSRAVLPSEALLARLGGDEFAVLVPGDAAAGEALAHAVHATLAHPVALRGVAVHVAASIGVADDTTLEGQDAATGRTAEALLRLADVAMYRAKRQRRGGLARYEPGAEPEVDRLHLTEQLRGALRGDDPDANGTLLVDIQPQVALDAAQGGRGRVVGAEALVRWRHPDEGVLAPGAFLPLADNAGLLPSLADVVLDAALAACRLWWDAGHQVPVAVNVSVGDVLDPGFVERVVAVLLSHDLPAHALTIELTEETLLVDPPRARAVLGSLRALGVGVSIDDYGSGYSSLAYLRELPADELKLDRAFVVDLAREATASSRAAAIVRTTADLAHSLGLRLVAEGVEDDDTLALLAFLGCDVAQGYGIARPMPPARFLDWLSQPVEATWATSAATG